MKTILLVDDSATILVGVSQALTQAGFKVETANNAEQALVKLKGGLIPNLIISDLNMPGMNGIEMIREIKKMPSVKFKPILMLTTESQGTSREAGKAAGATGWLVKPVKSEALLQVVNKVIK